MFRWQQLMHCIVKFHSHCHSLSTHKHSKAPFSFIFTTNYMYVCMYIYQTNYPAITTSPADLSILIHIYGSLFIIVAHRRTHTCCFDSYAKYVQHVYALPNTPTVLHSPRTSTQHNTFAVTLITAEYLRFHSPLSFFFVGFTAARQQLIHLFVFHLLLFLLLLCCCQHFLCVPFCFLLRLFWLVNCAGFC